MKRNTLIVIFVLMTGLSCFAQEQFYSAEAKSSQDTRLERQVKNEKETIKNSGYLDSLNSYLALRREDSSICNTQDCQNSMQNLLPFRYMAEGRCQKIKDRYQKELCFALQKSDCASLSNPLNDFCKGLVDKDIDLLDRISDGRDFSQVTGGVMSSDDVMEATAVYYGFKSYSTIACGRFLQGKELPLSLQLSCSVMLAEKPKKQVDSIMKDLAFFNLSRKNKDLDLCNSIDNYLVKDKCQNEIDKDLSEIW